MERGTGTSPIETEVRVVSGKVTLAGNLSMPEGARSVIAFAHGSGSSRNSPRNRLVARQLNQRSLATLLFDLLTIAEEAVDTQTAEFRFDIHLLAQRLTGATDWLLGNQTTRHLKIGYFGASTGAAAALVAAAQRPEQIYAVVSRGGRPDMAEDFLSRVRAPVLLIVGGRDHAVLDMNREALSRLQVEKELAVVPGATHLFEEPGALEEVARLAGDWFVHHI